MAFALNDPAPTAPIHLANADVLDQSALYSAASAQAFPSG